MDFQILVIHRHNVGEPAHTAALETLKFKTRAQADVAYRNLQNQISGLWSIKLY